MASAADERQPLSRADLASCTEEVLRPCVRAKPAILLVRWGGRRLLVKDFSQNSWLLRHIYGRWIVAHETRIYTCLAGVAGVPAFRGRLDSFAFAVDYIEAPSLKALVRATVPAAVFDRLAALHASLHERGIVHLDSHQCSNILVTPEGDTFLVDFATSLRLGTGWLARKLLLPFFAWADRLGLRKLKARYSAERLPPAEARSHRLMRALGWLWPFTAVRRLRRHWRDRTFKRRLGKAGRLDKSRERPLPEPAAHQGNGENQRQGDQEHH
jgi:predicted Ser/Thr protein kinase